MADQPQGLRSVGTPNIMDRSNVCAVHTLMYCCTAAVRCRTVVRSADQWCPGPADEAHAGEKVSVLRVSWLSTERNRRQTCGTTR